MRRFERLPNPSQIWLCEASYHDLTAAKEQHLELPNTTLIADLAYPRTEFPAHSERAKHHSLHRTKETERRRLN